MKVLVTAAQFSANISGVQRHAINLVRCMLRQHEIRSVHLVIAPWQHQLFNPATLDPAGRVTTHLANSTQSLTSRNLWYYRQLPELVEAVQPDIVHLTYPVPVPASRIERPVVLTLHDLYPYELPSNFGFPKVLFNRAILQHCLRGVNAIACVSDTTAQRLKEYAPRAVWNKALRIYNCVEPPRDSAEQIPPPGCGDYDFLLTISQHRRNKNIPLLIRALHRLRMERRISAEMKLIVVGICGPETARIHRLVADLQLKDRVLFFQGLSEPELEWCYRRCQALVAPSQTEGFGLPVAEALLRGCPVVCSDIPVFREIAQEHCQFFELGANAEVNLANAIVSTLERPRRLPLLLPEFSYDVVGAQYLDLYRSLLSMGTPSEERPDGSGWKWVLDRTAVTSLTAGRCERDHI